MKKSCRRIAMAVLLRGFFIAGNYAERISDFNRNRKREIVTMAAGNGYLQRQYRMGRYKMNITKM